MTCPRIVRASSALLAFPAICALWFGHTPTVSAGSAPSPAYEPAPGAYVSSVTVTISSPSPTAAIRYTLSGIAPTCTFGTRYSAPLTLTAPRTVKSIACESGIPTGAVTEGAYAIAVATPTFNVNAPGTFVGLVDVTLATSTPGAMIKYAVEGIAPTCTTGTSYAAPFTLRSSQTVKAIACKAGVNASDIALGSYVIEALDPPTVTPGGVALPSPSHITMSSAQSDVQIRYTIANAPLVPPSPTSSATLYTGPIALTRSVNVRARVFRRTAVPSAETTESYDLAAWAPTFTVDAPGTYAGIATIGFASVTPNATIRYITSGVDPTCKTGTVYAKPFPLTQSATVKAVACTTGTTPASITSGSFTITPLEAPVAHPDSGISTGSVVVTLTTATPGAQIRYALGTPASLPTDPTASSPLYAGPLTLDQTQILYARTFKGVSAPSARLEESYTIVAGTPVFSVNPPGTYEGFVTVTLSSPSSGAKMKYTLSGVDPTCETGTAYTMPLSFTYESMSFVRAIACKAGTTPSAVARGTYIVERLEEPIMPPDGLFRDSARITLGSTQSDVQIRYTIADWPNMPNPPTSNSALYTGPITLTRNTVMTAAVFKGPARPSAYLTRYYDVRPQPAVFTNDTPGEYEGVAMAGLSSPTPGATIRYKTSGIYLLDCTNGNVYRSPFPIAHSMTVTAVTCVPGMSPEATTRGDYIITPLTAPTIDPAGGDLATDATTISMLHASFPQYVRYTVGASADPTAFSSLYIAPFIPATNLGTFSMKARVVLPTSLTGQPAPIMGPVTTVTFTRR